MQLHLLLATSSINNDRETIISMLFNKSEYLNQVLKEINFFNIKRILHI
jgi:hypothetical protein